MNVLLGITGGIAAYKAAHLTRLLVSGGHAVRVVMTSSAKDFITPLTMATLSGNPIVVENFDPENGAWNSHISLGMWADVFVIAPATANTIAKMAGGVADNLLLCSYLSARCPVVIAPAMDLDMWAHPTTGRNVAYLQQLGVVVVNPCDGFLASGLIGKGRMANVEDIVQVVEHTGSVKDFAGVRVMVTAGSTIEKIDAVRYISNFSTGKMGRAIASELRARGADVELICGDMSASDMYDKASEAFDKCDIAIFAAAVADYTPRSVSSEKIKSVKGQGMTLDLAPTRDIASELSLRKRDGQLTIGFALETSNERANATQKLVSKHLDAIVLNSLADSGAGFGCETNKVTILDSQAAIEFELKSKAAVAVDIVNYIKSKRDC